MKLNEIMKMAKTHGWKAGKFNAFMKNKIIVDKKGIPHRLEVLAGVDGNYTFIAHPVINVNSYTAHNFTVVENISVGDYMTNHLKMTDKGVRYFELTNKTKMYIITDISKIYMNNFKFNHFSKSDLIIRVNKGTVSFRTMDSLKEMAKHKKRISSHSERVIKAWNGFFQFITEEECCHQ